jgi:hypothetical protein
MRNITPFFTVIFSSTVILSMASYSSPAASASISLSICEYIAADDKKRLRSFLKANHLKIRKVFNDLRCNDKNLLIFAAEKNSLATGKMIIGKLSKKIVANNISALQAYSPTLLESAKERIQ